MKRFRGILLLPLFIIVMHQATAQYVEEDTRSFWERTYFGGGLSLQLGNFTYVDLSPLMGYGFTQRFSTGFGITYRYVNDRFWNYSYSVYGGRLFSRFGILENIFVQGEYELLNWENAIRGFPEREWSSAIFIGPGYSSSLGGQKGYQIYIMYNLLYEAGTSPYNEPYVIRFSITF
jgi:hypothetical protein